MTIEESIHVTFDESNPKILGTGKVGTLEDMGIHEERRIEENEKDMPEISTHIPTEPQNELPKEWRALKHHPIDNIIGDISKGVTTRHSLNNACNFMAFVSQIEPKTIDEAISNEHWGIAMQEELNQFERNKFEIWSQGLMIIQ